MLSPKTAAPKLPQLRAVPVMRQHWGRLMDASHLDLRDDFAVTGPELDRMAALARSLPGCYGARMTGAGFGGCAVALVATSAVDDFVRELATRYGAEFDLPVDIFATVAAPGAGTLDLSNL